MASVRVWRAVMERGPVGAFEQFFKLRTFKFGRLVGVDRQGNHYYENTEEYKHGQHRWFEPPGMRPWFDVDGSEISPEWYSWLHQSTDDPPTESGVGSVYKLEPQRNVREVHTPFDRNLGGVVTPHSVNQSQRRPRGYGLGNSLRGPLAVKANEEGYYTQPGWALDPRHVHAKKEVPWTLMETAASFAERRNAELGPGTAKALDAVKQQILGDSSAKAVATLGADVEMTQPAGRDLAANRTLSMRSEGTIRNEMLVCQGIVDEYSGFRGFKDADEAVARAKDQLLGLHDELNALLEAQAELEN